MVKYKYIIMCGGKYESWETPRQLSVVCGEEIVARTIRLLRENGVEDINISSNNSAFEKFGVPVLKHNNTYDINTRVGDWYDAFYPTDEPTCYIFGDVVFSPEAIKKIINTETNDMEFFGSAKPYAKNYIKTHEEPFALKVMNTNHLKEAVKKTRELDRQGKFWRKPIMWELWTVIKNAPLQTKRDQYTTDYIAINDYTCDVDRKDDIIKLSKILGGNVMVKLEATRDFTLLRFKEVRIIKRKNKEQEGWLYTGDVFECDDELADYLLGNNEQNLSVAQILEVISTASEEEKIEADKIVSVSLTNDVKDEEVKNGVEIVKPKRTNKTKKSKK